MCYLIARFLELTGYVRTTWNQYEPLLNFDHTETEIEVTQELFGGLLLRRNRNKSSLDEIQNFFYNTK